MNRTTLEQIEADIGQLSLSEQLWLIERPAHRIRRSTLPTRVNDESDLDAMASDPAIQHELAQIEAEFAGMELDGLAPER